MNIQRVVVPVPEERDTPSSSLALLALLSLSVLVLIVLFFAVRLLKRGLHLPSLTWLRGKGQGTRGRLGLSGVELLPISLKSIPTPNPSPYAASFNIVGNAGKPSSTTSLARSSSVDELSPFPASTPPSPSTSPRSRPQLNLPSLFKSKNKSLHRRSKSLGLPTRHLLPPTTSLTNGSSAPSTPQSLLIDFSTSSSSTSTSSDLGTQKFSPASPPLIPGIPIPVPSPTRHSATKPHTFSNSSHLWAFDVEDDVEVGHHTNADPLLAAFKRSQSTTPPNLQSDSHPLIRYNCSPSPLRVPPTPSLAPRHLGTANPFASLNGASGSPTYAAHRPLSPSPLSLSPSSPLGIELVLTKPIPALTLSVKLVEFDTDEQLDVTDATRAIDSMAPIAVLETPSISPSSPETDDPFGYVQPAVENALYDHAHKIEEEALDSREELVADPFDDVNGVGLPEDAWNLRLSPASSIEHPLSTSLVEYPQLLSGPPSPVLTLASPAATSSSLTVPTSSSGLEPKSLAWQWDNAWTPIPLPMPPQSSRPLDTVSQDDIGAEDQDKIEKSVAVDEADLILFERYAAIEDEAEEAIGVEEEAKPAATWFIEEPTVVWDPAWSNEGIQAGGLFDKGVEEEEVHDVHIPILDGLLAGPSDPVDIQLTEELVKDAPSHQDEHDDINDIHDTTAIFYLTVATSTTTATTSLLSTPTTSSTPLPALPAIITELITDEECPDPELLPLPVLPLPTLSVSPVLLSPQSIKPLSSGCPLSPAQTPTPPASPPPTQNVPTRPLWSLRAADAPPLSLAAADASAAPVRAALAPFVAVMSAVVPATSTPVVIPEVESIDEVEVKIMLAASGPAPEADVVDVVDDAGVTVVVEPPTGEQQEMPEGTRSLVPTPALSTSLPGSFPSSPSPPSASLPAPTPIAIPSESASAALASFSTEPRPSTTRAVQLQHRTDSNRLRTPRSALDLALAMQLRPGLGAGADPAWMVRFLMALFGWLAVLVSGDI